MKIRKSFYFISLLCTVLFLTFACSLQSNNGQIKVKGGSFTLGDNIHHALYDANVADLNIDYTEVTNQQFADVYNWAIENNQLYIYPSHCLYFAPCAIFSLE